MKKIPQTKGNELIHALNAKKNASASTLSPNDIAMAKIRKQIQEVLATDPIEGWSLECMYQAAIGNVEALMAAKDNFIRLNGTGVPLYNVAVALFELGLFSDAVKVIKRQLTPQSGYFTSLISIAFCSGMFEDLANAYDMILEKGMHFTSLEEENLDFLQTAKNHSLFLKEHKLKTEHCTQLLDIAGLVVRENQCRIVRNTVLDMLDDDDSQKQLNFFLYIPVSSETCFQMNSDLIEKIEQSTMPLKNSPFIDVLLMQAPITPAAHLSIKKNQNSARAYYRLNANPFTAQNLQDI